MIVLINTKKLVQKLLRPANLTDFYINTYSIFSLYSSIKRNAQQSSQTDTAYIIAPQIRSCGHRYTVDTADARFDLPAVVIDSRVDDSCCFTCS